MVIYIYIYYRLCSVVPASDDKQVSEMEAIVGKARVHGSNHWTIGDLTFGCRYTFTPRVFLLHPAP